MAIASLLACGAAGSLAGADVYTWRGPDGVVHYSDYPKHEGYTPLEPVSSSGITADRYAHWDRDRIRSEIVRLARVHRLDPGLIEVVVRVESNFDPVAVSHKGAMGLMQLMPATAAFLGVHEPFDPAQNLEGGTRLLRRLLDRFEGKLDWALAAYHAGASRVDAAQGVPRIRSTQRYVRKILDLYPGAS